MLTPAGTPAGTPAIVTPVMMKSIKTIKQVLENFMLTHDFKMFKKQKSIENVINSIDIKAKQTLYEHIGYSMASSIIPDINDYFN